MNPQEEIRYIIENTDGECWHEFPQQGVVASVEGGHNIFCEKGCTVFVPTGTKYDHPSPHDLNELDRLAEKNGVYSGNWKMDEDGGYHVLIHNDDTRRPEILYGATLADALRACLVKAIEGRG
jgi:hypothetical protein